eukprot:m51a1_g9440 hypothetical protein (142) ;mRNA; f:446014-446554
MSLESAVQAQTVNEVPHGSWTLCFVHGDQLILGSTGKGVEALKAALPNNDCAYALISLRVELKGTTDSPLDKYNQPRHIFIQWKGPNAPLMKKVAANQAYQLALETLRPNHGQLEVIGKTHFDEPTLASRWKPEAGSHVID